MPRLRWLSVSGQGDPVSELACRHDSHWLSLAYARDMTMSTKTWRYARQGKVGGFAKWTTCVARFRKCEQTSCFLSMQLVNKPRSTMPYNITYNSARMTKELNIDRSSGSSCILASIVIVLVVSRKTHDELPSSKLRLPAQTSGSPFMRLQKPPRNA